MEIYVYYLKLDICPVCKIRSSQVSTIDHPKTSASLKAYLVNQNFYYTVSAKEVLLLSSSIARPTDPMAFQNLTDPNYFDFYLENDGYDNNGLQSTCSASPFNSNDDFLASPHDITLKPETFSPWEIEDAALNFNSLFGSDSISSLNHSRTPSLCDDTDSLPQSPKPAESSPLPEAPSKRKRGRPRLTREDSESSCSDSSRSRKLGISKRQPHHEVERKYREGLNAGLERLRMAVPTLPRQDSQAMDAPPKPSKATILAGAIDYIRQIEKECDRLQRENEILKTAERISASRFSLS